MSKVLPCHLNLAIAASHLGGFYVLGEFAKIFEAVYGVGGGVGDSIALLLSHRMAADASCESESRRILCPVQ